MANTSRLLIFIIFTQFFPSCASEVQEKTETSENIALLECKPYQQGDGSTAYSIYAVIGVNQTKVANSDTCLSLSPEQLALDYPKRHLLGMLKGAEASDTFYIYLERKNDNIDVIRMNGTGVSVDSIATFKNGKFFFY